MHKLQENDFRAFRTVLDPDDFALSDGQPDVATDLIDEDTWDEITHLPSDVSIRTSNHFGSLLSKLNQLQGVWIQDAIGDVANPERLLYREMVRRGTSFWEWSKEE